MSASAGIDYAFVARLERLGRGATTERVTALIREAIVGLDLAPGADIDKPALCERLGVSRFPVSEALARLQAEGLVEILPQRGSRVSPIQLGEVRQSLFIRRALEAETVRALAAAPSPVLLVALSDNLEAQRRAVREQDRIDFHRLDLGFHQLLVDGLGFARVRAAIEASRATLDRVRRLLSSPRRHALTLVEHEAILAGLADRDAGLAGLAMERHIDAVMAELVAFAASHPGIFGDLEGLDP